MKNIGLSQSISQSTGRKPTQGDLEPSFELPATSNGLGILHGLIASKSCMAFLFV